MHRRIDDEIAPSGSLYTEYRYDQRTPGGVLFVVAAVGMGVVFLHAVPVVLACLYGVFSGGTLATAIWMAVVLMAGSRFLKENRKRNTKVQVFERGLAYTFAGQTEVCQWDQITEIGRDAGSGRMKFYRLALTDGRILTINSTYFRKKDIEQLGRVLRNQTKESASPPQWTPLRWQDLDTELLIIPGKGNALS